MFTEELTITIPVFERTDFFDEALASALKQTGRPRIVVVDNASSHSWFEDAVRALGDERVVYVRNPSNLGLYGNWNRCAEVATTPFFTILGDDDVMDPDYVETFLKARREHPEITFFYSDIERFGECHKEHPLSRMPFGLVTGRELLINAVDVGLGFPTGAMTLARSLFVLHRFLHTTMAYNQDWLFVYTALADQIGFGSPNHLIRFRIHHKGNSLAVGMRAFLSTTLIFQEIAAILTQFDARKARLARLRARWVPRNAVIAGHASVLREQLSKAAEGSPFGLALVKALASDPILRLAIGNGGVTARLAYLILRVMRFARRPIEKRLLSQWRQNHA